MRFDTLRKIIVSDRNCYDEGLQAFKSKIKESDSLIYKKKYFYVNIWSLGCPPCVEEIPFLDLLPDYINKDLAYLLISFQSSEAVNLFLTKNKIETKNLIFLNDLDGFIAGIFQEIEIKDLTLPLHVIMQNDGTILAYSLGSINSLEAADNLINFTNNLP